MSTPTILPGQFYKAIPAGDEPIVGWTVITVESGYLGEGTAEHGLARVWVIRNDTRTATPELQDFPIIEEWVKTAVWTHANGPVKPAVAIEDLPRKVRQKIKKIEEHRYQLIRPIVELGNDALQPHVRREALKKRALEVGLTVDNLWQLLCLYWQFGGRHGLRPRAVLAGQKSLARRVEVAREMAEADTSGKASPADFFKPYKTGPKSTEGVLEGKPLEYADVVQCQRGARRFLFKASKDGKLHYDFKKAYKQTLRVEYDYVDAGSIKPNRPAPSYEQFVGAVCCDPEFDRLSARIVGAVTAVRSHRQTKDTTQNQVLGPGHVLQIDDMETKVVVVSAFNREPIGTARFFLGVDQWSGLACGAHETLAGSGYEGVRELIVNVATPKAPFLEEQGYSKEISAAYLPGHGLFAEVSTDNGPLRALLGDILPKNLMSLSNVALHRGDLKANAEASFLSFLKKVAETLPGFTRVERYIGLPDSDAVACLTMAELRKIIWAWMAAYNTRVRDTFLPEGLLHLNLKERPENTPYQLFPSGLIHISGKLRGTPLDEIRRLLLRTATGTLTGRRGILFHGLHYFIDDDQPYRFKSVKVQISYSENYSRQIFVWIKGERCTASLCGSEADTFGDKSFPEIAVELKHRRITGRRARSHNLRVDVSTLDTVVAQTVAGAVKARDELQLDPNLRKVLSRMNRKSTNRVADQTSERRIAAAKDATVFPPVATKEAPPPPTPLRKKSMRDLRRQSVAPEPAFP